MKKITFSCAIVLITLTVKGQVVIKDPGVYNEQIYTLTKINEMHSSLELKHASPKIEWFNSTEAFHYPDLNWPAGTWFQGYYNTNNPGGYPEWYNNGFSNHPLVRESGRYTLGYLHGYRSLSSNSEFNDRAVSGIDYLVSCQRGDGSYTWWRFRPGQDTPNMDETAYSNTTEMMECANALKGLSEGYWYKRCHLGQSATATQIEKDAIINSANYIVNNFTGSASNSNIKGLCAWGLATAYKATGNTNYKAYAETLSSEIVASQDPNSGMWSTGNNEYTEAIPTTGTANLQLWLSGDFNGDGKEELLQKYNNTAVYLHYADLNLGNNNLYFGTGHIEKWIAGDFNGDGKIQVLHKFYNNPDVYLWSYGNNFGTNAIYTAGAHIEKWIAGDFDNDGKDEVLHKFSNSNVIYLWNDTPFGSNSVYTAGGTIENWLVGNFDTDSNKEVLLKFQGNSYVYLWNFGSTFGSNSIYTAGAHIEKWIAGDFNNDGHDDVLQKYATSSYIYLWIGSNSFGSNAIYTGSANIENWIAGDFDGDSNDEVLQKYENVSTIYQWDYGYAFGANQKYAGSAHTTNWIVVDIDGDNKDELFQEFDSEVIYYWNNAQYCMGCYAIFNIPSYTYAHDTRIGYQFYVLGGLIETYSITSGSTKDNIAQSIKKCVNNIIDRLHPTETNKINWFYQDIYGVLIPQFVREKYSYNMREAMQQLPQLAYYAQSDAANFSATDITRIKSLSHRLVHADYPGYAYYKDYMNALNNGLYLDYYGGCSQGTFNKRSSEENSEMDILGNVKEFAYEESINISPNPFQSTTTVNFESNKAGVYDLILLNYLGQIVYSSKVHVETGSNLYELNLENNGKGMYLLQVVDKNRLLYKEKIIVQ